MVLSSTLPMGGYGAVRIPQGREGPLARIGTEPGSGSSGEQSQPLFGVRGPRGLWAWEELGLDPCA